MISSERCRHIVSSINYRVRERIVLMKKVMSEAQANFLRDLALQSADVLTKYAYRFFGYQLHMREIAEEAVQDTYLKAVEDIESLMIHPNPIGWLKVSLRNILLNIKRKQHWKYEESKDVIRDIPDKRLYAALDAFDEFDRYPRLKELEKVVNTILTPAEADTFYDHFLCGLTTEETAILECVSNDTVRGRISRIRKKLRKHYKIPCFLLLLLFYR